MQGRHEHLAGNKKCMVCVQQIGHRDSFKVTVSVKVAMVVKVKSVGGGSTGTTERRSSPCPTNINSSSGSPHVQPTVVIRWWVSKLSDFRRTSSRYTAGY